MVRNEKNEWETTKGIGASTRQEINGMSEFRHKDVKTVANITRGQRTERLGQIVSLDYKLAPR